MPRAIGERLELGTVGSAAHIQFPRWDASLHVLPGLRLDNSNVRARPAWSRWEIIYQALIWI